MSKTVAAYTLGEKKDGPRKDLQKALGDFRETIKPLTDRFMPDADAKSALNILYDASNIKAIDPFSKQDKHNQLAKAYDKLNENSKIFTSMDSAQNIKVPSNLSLNTPSLEQAPNFSANHKPETKGPGRSL